MDKMKRRRVTIEQVRAYAKENGVENANELGIMGLVDVEDMGFCKDGVTRWYTFELDGEPCIWFKH